MGSAVCAMASAQKMRASMSLRFWLATSSRGALVRDDTRALGGDVGAGEQAGDRVDVALLTRPSGARSTGALSIAALPLAIACGERWPANGLPQYVSAMPQ